MSLQRGRSILVALLWVCCGLSLPLRADEGLSEANLQHFASLRRRGLHRLAETELEHRLTWPRLKAGERTSLVLELAETLLSHARQLGESQRVALWERTREVIQAQLPNETEPARMFLLQLQLVLVDREETEACCRLATIAPWNQQSRDRGLRAATGGLSRLRQLHPFPSGTGRGTTRSGSQTITAAQKVRLQILQAELQTGEALLLPDNSDERAARLVAARQTLQTLVEQRTELEQAEWARVLLARVLRCEGDTRAAKALIDASRRKSQNSQIRAALAREEAECRLVESDLNEARRLATELYPNPAPEVSTEPGAWDDWLVAARVWIACWRSGMKSHSRLATRDLETAQQILQRGVQVASGEWRELFGRLSESLEEEVAIGPDLAHLSLQIQQALGQHDDQQADLLLARGAELALRRGLRDRAAEWGFQRGALAVERKDWQAAAADLLNVSRESSNHPKAPEAQLLGAYALGRQWRDQMSEEAQREYRAALEEFCQRFPEDSRRAEAEWMLGELCRRVGDLDEAAEHFDRIPRGHPRSAGAVRGLADLTIQAIRTEKLGMTGLELLREKLQGRLPAQIEDLQTDDTPLILALAELELAASQPDWKRVEELLQWAEASISMGGAPAPAAVPAEEPLPSRASPDSASLWRLQVLAAAAQSHWEQVDRLFLDPAPLKMGDLLDLVDKVAMAENMAFRTGHSHHGANHADFPERIARRLDTYQRQMSGEEQLRLELILARWFLGRDEPHKARVRFQRAVDLGPDNPATTLEFARFLLGLAEPESRREGVELLVRRERHWKPGSDDWLNARIELIKGLQLVGRAEEACRLLKKTQLLYPAMGTPAQKKILAELRAKCP
jgi:hypothetical protein